MTTNIMKNGKCKYCIVNEFKSIEIYTTLSIYRFGRTDKTFARTFVSIR